MAEGGAKLRHKILLSILVFVLAAQSSWAQIPQSISYQGVLTDAGGTPVADGTYSLTFGIYDGEASGTALWTETHASVTVASGIFNVILGSITPLDIEFDQQYWLGIAVGGGAEMKPRIQLTSSAYSLNSQSVINGAVTTDKLATGAVTTVKLRDGSVVESKIADNAVTTSKLFNNSVTGEKIASGQVVKSINGKTDDVLLEAGANVTIKATGNTLTISSSSDDAWGLSGNSGTTAGTNFLGTTDNKPLQLHVNGLRALRLEPHATSPNIIGGYSGNSVTPGVYGATIAGGGQNTYENRVTDHHGTVSGGIKNHAGGNSCTVGGGFSNETAGSSSTVSGGGGNTADGDHCTVGGGGSNTASDAFATVSGGGSNTASGYDSTVGGGSSNTASAARSTVCGGYDNTASGADSTVCGGNSNAAGGRYSLAAGYQAKIDAAHDGTFLFADFSPGLDFNSAAANEFAVRCTGGARFVTDIDGSGTPTKWAYLDPSTATWSVQTSSDRNLKANFTQIDGLDILERLADIPIESWNYRDQDPPVKHIGPMAQDFHAAFGLGKSDKYIDSLDADGVALAAIQGLYDLVKEKDAQIAALEARLAALEAAK